MQSISGESFGREQLAGGEWAHSLDEVDMARALAAFSERVRVLWVDSPSGDSAVREGLVMELLMVDIAVERVALRASLDAADPEVAIELGRLDRVLDGLERRWRAPQAA